MKIIYPFSKHKKTAVLSVSILFSALLAAVFISKIMIVVMVDKSELKNNITDFFETHMNKAVNFDEINIGVSGKTRVKNFRLSSSPDFHEGDDMIRSRIIEINFSYFSLLSGEPLITGIRMNRPEFNLRKRMGVSHAETLNSLLGFEIDPSVSSLFCPERGVSFTVRNALVSYSEFSPRAKYRIDIEDVDLRLLLTQKKIIFTLNGSARNDEDTDAGTGYLEISGSYINPESFELKILLNRINAAVLKDVLEYSGSDEIGFSGLISTETFLSMSGGVLKISGDTGFDSVHLVNRRNGFIFMSNYHLDINHEFDYDTETGGFELHGISFSDGNLFGSASGSFNGERVDIEYSLDRLSLWQLSSYFKPLPDYYFSGELASSGKLKLSFPDQSAEGSSFSLRVKDMSLIHASQVKETAVINSAELDISFNDNALQMFFEGNIERGDLSLFSRTEVREWEPLSTDTVLNARSDRFEGKYFYRLLKTGILNLNNAAVAGATRGMHDVLFSQKPAGKAFRNNDIVINMSARSILAGASAEFSGFRAGISLNSGILSLDEFSLEGYGADYDLSLIAYLNRDVPYIRIGLGINGFDMGSFYDDYGLAGSLSGKVSCTLDYSFIGYRIDQFLSNSRGRLYIFSNGGTVQETKLQEKLTGFLIQNDFYPEDINNLEFSSFNIGVNLLADTYHIRSFSLNSDMINYYGQGKYTFLNGLSLSFAPRVKNHEGRMQPVNIEVSGPFLSPCISFKDTDGLGVCF